MARSRIGVIAAVSLYLLASGTLPQAQTTAPASGDPTFGAVGFQQNRDYFSPLPFEHVDTTNGNLVLSFTDLTLPGNAGFNLAFQPAYNISTGWTFGIAGIPLSVAPYQPEPASDPDDEDHWSLPQFTTADGSNPTTLWKHLIGTGETLITSQFWLYDPPSRTLTMPNGLVATFQPDGPLGARLSEVTDPFGNVVKVFWGGRRHRSRPAGAGQRPG